MMKLTTQYTAITAIAKPGPPTDDPSEDGGYPEVLASAPGEDLQRVEYGLPATTHAGHPLVENRGVHRRKISATIINNRKLKIPEMLVNRYPDDQSRVTRIRAGSTTSW